MLPRTGMLRFFFALCAFVVVLCAASSARADKVAVLPFTATQALPEPELEREVPHEPREETVERAKVEPVHRVDHRAQHPEKIRRLQRRPWDIRWRRPAPDSTPPTRTATGFSPAMPSR